MFSALLLCAAIAAAAHAHAAHGPDPSLSAPLALGQWMESRLDQAGGSWRGVDNPARGLLLDVAIVSPYEAWAVGMADSGAPGEILHFHDNAWRVFASDPDWILWAVEAVSVDDIWIAGFTIDAGLGGALLHIVAGELQPVIDAPCSSLLDLHFSNPTDGWAVGNLAGAGGEEACILHYEGGRWERVGVSSSALLVGVELTSPSTGWAIGTRGQTLRYRDGAWLEVVSPVSASDAGMFFGLDLVDDAKGWAVGTRAHQILHLHQGVWDVADTGLPGRLLGVSMIDADSGWFVGDDDGRATVLMARYAQGKWQAEEPNGTEGSLTAVTTSGDDHGWAVGRGAILNLGPPPPSPTPVATFTATATDAVRTPTPTATGTPSTPPVTWSVFLPWTWRPSAPQHRVLGVDSSHACNWAPLVLRCRLRP